MQAFALVQYYSYVIALRLLSPNNPQRDDNLLESIRYTYNYTIPPSCLNTQATAHIRMLSRISQLSRHLSGPIMATPQNIRFNKPISTSACLIIGDEVLNGKVSIRPNTPIQEVTYRRIGSGYEQWLLCEILLRSWC